MSKLLINEPPLQVLPSLAKAIGLNEAIILQQIHYWVSQKKHFYDGRFWTYNTYKEWLKQFEFISESTLKRAVRKLEDLRLIDSDNYSKSPFDHTKWYTINYETLDSWTIDEVNLTPSDEVNLTPSITETTKTNKTYIEGVSLTADEHTKLINRFGKDLTDRCVDKLSAYLGSRGRKYKSHYLTILNWVVEWVLQNNPPKSLTKPQMDECEKKWSSIRGKYNYDRTSEIWVLK